MLLQLVNFTDTQLRGIWNCLQTTYNELLSKSYQKKKKSLPLSVEYSTDNSRLDSLINSYLHYRYSHAYLHHNDVLRRNARVHDGCNALPDYSSGFRLYNSSLLRLHFHLHHQTTGFRLLQVQSVHHHRSHRRSGLQHLHSSKMMTVLHVPAHWYLQPVSA